MSGASGEVVERARALALVLGIQPGTYAGREEQAALIMAHLAAMPSIREHNRRRLYGVEILQNTNRLFPPDVPDNRAFMGRVQGIVADMQTFPAWSNRLTYSNAELIREYKRTENAVWILWSLGMGGAASLLPSAGRTGVKEAQALRNRPVPPGQRPPTGRQIAVAGGRGVITGARNSFTGGLSGRLGGLWVIGSGIYLGARDHQSQLSNEITRRFQEGRMSSAEYRSVFGRSVALPQQFDHRQ